MQVPPGYPQGPSQGPGDKFSDFATGTEWVMDPYGLWKPLNTVHSAECTIKEDFLFSSSETGEIGELGWSFTNGTASTQTPEAGHPGILRRMSASTQNQIASMYPGGNNTATRCIIDELRMLEFIARPVAPTTDVIVRVGIADTLNSSPPSNGMYVEHLNTDSNWFGVCRASNAQTRLDLGVAYDVSWRDFRIVYTPGAGVGFYSGDTLIGTITQNIPSSVAALFGIDIIPTQASARAIDLDYFALVLATSR